MSGVKYGNILYLSVPFNKEKNIEVQRKMCNAKNIQRMPIANIWITFLRSFVVDFSRLSSFLSPPSPKEQIVWLHTVSLLPPLSPGGIQRSKHTYLSFPFFPTPSLRVQYLLLLLPTLSYEVRTGGRREGCLPPFFFFLSPFPQPFCQGRWRETAAQQKPL